jgi:C-terminal processing protease CtpA/Prc
MKKTTYIFLIFVFLIFSQGCVNNYEKFYKENNSTVLAVQNNPQDFELLSEGQSPRIIFVNIDNKADEFARLKSAGYRLIGESGFSGASVTDPNKDIMEQAKKVGATLVVAVNKFKGSVETTTTTQQANNMHTNYSGVYGQNLGNALTTYFTPTTKTSSYDKYSQHAYYLVKNSKKLRFGLQTSNLTSDLKKELGRNTGALVNIVMDDSPVFLANIMSGDVIIKIDGVDVGGGKRLKKILTNIDTSVKSVVFTIIRDGKELQKTVVLDE